MISKRNKNKVAEFFLLSATFFLLIFLIKIPLFAFDAAIIEAQTDQIMEKYVGKEVPGAALAVVKDGRILFSKGYGYADLKQMIPVVAEETIFEYGSINKLFVWISLLQLSEEGLLNLDDDIGNYLSEEIVKGRGLDEKISLLDLMNHSAGFEDTFFDFANKKMTFLPPLDKVLKRTLPARVFRAGEVMSYSNYGAALAAFVVEEVSGQKFYDYERQHIFLPANMQRIAGHPLYINNPELMEEKASGYNAKKSGFKDVGWVYVPAYPSGAANGTVEALANFALALTPEEAEDCPFFKTASYYEKIFNKTYQADKLASSVSHGFWEYDGIIKSYGHDGNTAGFSSHFAISPKERLGLIVLANSGSESDFFFELHESVFGSFTDGQPKKKIMAEPGSKELKGKYLMTRAAFSNFMEFFFYLSPSEIKDLGEGKIKLILSGHEASYDQVSPYKYEIRDYSSLLIKYSYPELYFEMGPQGVKKLSSGNAPDLIPFNTFRSTIWVYFSLIFFLTALLFILVNPILIFKFRFHNEFPISRTLTALNILGISLVISTILLLYRALKYMYYSSKWVLPFLYINLGISLSVLLLSGIIFLQRKKFFTHEFYWRNFQFYSLIMVIFIFLLYNWNFLKPI